MAGFRFVIPQNFFAAGAPAADITVIPDKQFNKQVTPRRLVASFGDGYEQAISDGINPIEEQFSASFVTRDRDEIDNIVAFFDQQAGVTAFDVVLNDHRVGITAPNEKTIKVRCINWSQIFFHDEYYSCTATFKRVYVPTAP